MWPPSGTALLSPCQPVDLQDRADISNTTVFKMILTWRPQYQHLSFPRQSRHGVSRCIVVTGVVTLTLNRTLVAVLWLSKQEFSWGRQNKESILGQETQLAILGTSSCYLYTRGIAHCPYVDAWRVHWVFYSNNRTRHGSRPTMPRCSYQSALKSLLYTRPANQN